MMVQSGKTGQTYFPSCVRPPKWRSKQLFSRELEIDWCWFDEASVIPLAVWPHLMNAAGGKRFVVAGDPMQLMPIQARDQEVATHIWFDNNIYSHLGMSTFRGIEPFLISGSVTLLNWQTRMSKGIGRLVSGLFYNSLLDGSREDCEGDWNGLNLPSEDVAFVDPEREKEAYGVGRLPPTYLNNTNTLSAGWVVETVRSLVRKNPHGHKLEVLVITPYRNQTLKIYGPRFRGMSNSDVTVKVSTVHRCQGMEADIVFFDLVKPSSWFVNKPDSMHLWCVACSRARSRLVFVGNRHQMMCGSVSSRVLGAIENPGRKIKCLW